MTAIYLVFKNGTRGRHMENFKVEGRLEPKKFGNLLCNVLYDAGVGQPC
jgi:hypothetical protein